MSPWANYFAAPNLEERQHIQSGFETFQQLRIPNFQSKSMKTKNVRELHQIKMCVNVKNNYFIRFFSKQLLSICPHDTSNNFSRIMIKGYLR